MSVLAEPISPELILVSPPEIARIARAQLHEFTVELPTPRRTPALELAAVYLFCLSLTLGPVLFLMAMASG